MPGWSPAVSPAVSVLHERAGQYVAMRRSLGYKFSSQARMLAGFADYLAARGDTLAYPLTPLNAAEATK